MATLRTGQTTDFTFNQDEGFKNYTLAVGIEGNFEDYNDWMRIKEEFKNAPAYSS